MSDLFGNHIVGFPTRRLICSATVLITYKLSVINLSLGERSEHLTKDIRKTCPCNIQRFFSAVKN